MESSNIPIHPQDNQEKSGLEPHIPRNIQHSACLAYGMSTRNVVTTLLVNRKSAADVLNPQKEQKLAKITPDQLKSVRVQLVENKIRFLREYSFFFNIFFEMQGLVQIFNAKISSIR